jgi:hypothetical protein
LTGADALVHAAANTGVRVCLANPGTTQMHLVAALDRVEGVQAVLGLFARSHDNTVSSSFGDAPRADEVGITFACATRGRLHERLGGVAADQIRGERGLRRP